MSRVMTIEVDEETARKIAKAAGKFEKISAGKVIDLMFADVDEYSLFMFAPWNKDTDMAREVVYDEGLLGWLLSGQKWTVDELADIYTSKECYLQQIENCIDGLANSDSWDEWNYDGDGVRKDEPVFESKDKYIERYNYDLYENIGAAADAIREINEIKSDYEEDTGRNLDPMEWVEQLHRFKDWYNTLYNPSNPISL